MDWKTFVEENFENINKYNVLGLRALRPDEKYEIGDRARNSYDWDMENDCSSEEELDGTSTIQVVTTWITEVEELIEAIEDEISNVENYSDGKIVLLGGWASSDGTDEGEQVIENAIVLAVIREEK